jgi:hypothetical protein
MNKEELLLLVDTHTQAFFDLRASLPDELSQYSPLISEIIITHEDVRKSIEQDLL